MKQNNAAVPYTPQEIVTAAVESHQAGAAVIHTHVRDPETGAPSSNAEYFREVLDGIVERCDVIVNLRGQAALILKAQMVQRKASNLFT